VYADEQKLIELPWSRRILQELLRAAAAVAAEKSA
jgi:hypothetical protein